MIKFFRKLLNSLNLMGIKFGEVDASQIVDNEYRSKFITKVIDWIFKNNPNLTKPSQEEIDKMKNDVVEELQARYPKSGVGLRKK